MLEIAEADAQLVRIFSLRQPQFRSNCLDLFALTISQKEIVVIQKAFDRNFKKLSNSFHVLQWIDVFAVFFIVDIGAPVYTGIVCYVSLPQAILVSKPAELVRCFGDFCEVRKLQIELFCVLKLVRQYHRKLKNLERGYFYRTRYIGNQNIAADSHSRQKAPFCLKRHPFRHLNCRFFRCDSIAFAIPLSWIFRLRDARRDGNMKISYRKRSTAMYENHIADISLAPEGEKKIRWVAGHMPVLAAIAEDFRETKPFAGLRVTLSVHLEAKTAWLCRVMEMGGAEMHVTGSNPLSTQDDVAAALAAGGMHVCAVHGATGEQYQSAIDAVLETAPNIIIDDGGDLVHRMHTKYPELIPQVIGGCEETTTGILRLLAMDRAGELRFPMMLVNDADCKHLFDNRYGTGQSVWDGIMRTTNLIVAGKEVVVCGYGWCGKGVAMRAHGLGARVIVTEVDPVRAIEAHMDGFTVLPMDEAAKRGDIFVTVTGCDDVISARHVPMMKDGAILSNAGHFDVEVNVAALREMAVEHYEARHNIEGYVLPNGKTLFVLAEGRLVNLASGDGHPAEIMDMSFAVQAMSAKYLADHRAELHPGVIRVPHEIDDAIARKKLSTLGITIDTLTEEQKKYLGI